MSREIPNEAYLFVGGSADGKRLYTGGQSVWRALVEERLSVLDFPSVAYTPPTCVQKAEMYESVPFQAGGIKTEIFVPMSTQGDKGEFALLALINDYAKRRERR